MGWYILMKSRDSDVIEDHEATWFAILSAHDSIQEQLEEKSVAALVLQEGAEVQEEWPGDHGTTSCRDQSSHGPRSSLHIPPCG